MPNDGDSKSESQIRECVIALWAGGRAGPESPGSQSSSLRSIFHSCHPSWKLPHHAAKHASVAFSEANARLDGWLMFHKLAFMSYIVYFYPYCWILWSCVLKTSATQKKNPVDFWIQFLYIPDILFHSLLSMQKIGFKFV